MTLALSRRDEQRNRIAFTKKEVDAKRKAIYQACDLVQQACWKRQEAPLKVGYLYVEGERLTWDEHIENLLDRLSELTGKDRLPK